ncbi:hypothetical protein LHYA1_G001740 [Lachnellula hyalina]|uniref:Uncharacterized protein n=1 Tax=Lachnellula hyalina TaxID=1316788 RepID=A0A8H8R7G9_9HELO|nr:uncharacterized protein LHYA1_G001740 [Lachnellula hyalina]TVY29869.1 hypothetical protein LHYA1_G001740 [Lachnellula hyalina]
MSTSECIALAADESGQGGALTIAQSILDSAIILAFRRRILDDSNGQLDSKFSSEWVNFRVSGRQDMKKSFQEDFAFLKWPTPGTPCPASRTSKRCKTPANVGYSGSYSVPALWERKKKTIVSNDSVGIMRSLSTSFDEFLEPRLRKVNNPVQRTAAAGAGEGD